MVNRTYEWISLKQPRHEFFQRLLLVVMIRFAARRAYTRPWARLASVSSQTTTASDPFDTIFKICTAEEFLEGAKQAHCAVGSLLISKQGSSPILTGLVTHRFQRFIDELHRRDLSLARVVHPDEHAMEARIASITLSPRPQQVAEGQTPQPPVWSAIRPSIEKSPEPVAVTPETDVEGLLSQIHSGLSIGDDLSYQARTTKASELARKYFVHCTVDMVVACPPERHYPTEEIAFYEAAFQDADSVAESKNYAKLLAVSGVYSFFRIVDRVLFALFKTHLAIMIGTIPGEIFRLPSDFATKPPSVRKAVRFELTPDLRWEVDHVHVDPSFIPTEPAA